jgi:NADPH:quinone reductase-like Zn-dependent oxidoreductase
MPSATSTATAVVATGFGGPEVLALRDVDVPDPGPGEVTLRVRAAGINPVDHKLYSGALGRDASRLPMRLGSEVAGEVTAVGPDAVGPAGPVGVGDEVIAYRVQGGYAEALTVPAATVVPKPAELSWEQAAGMMLAGATAVHALTVVGATAGQVLLVHGASGGVGLSVVQIAVHDGLTVIATSSERHFAALRRYGAVPVAYGEGLVERVRDVAPGGVDAAIDCVGTDEAVDTSLELVADRGRIVTIAAFGRAADAGIKVIGNGPGADPGTQVRQAARLRLVQLVREGALDVVVARTFPLREVAAAHELVAGGHAGGKVVLIP